MGDYADCITKDDKRFDSKSLAPWVESDNIVESQRRRIKELFEPVKDRILLLCTGNHEESIRLHHSDNLTRNLCHDLGVSYGGYHCFLHLEFMRSTTRYPFIFHIWHGAGAAQTEGARILRLMRLVNEFVASIYLMGHLHGISVYSVSRLSLAGGRIRNTDVKAACTGAWLKTYNQPDPGEILAPGYGERQGYKPSCIGCPTIRLFPYRKQVSIEI